MISHRGRGKPVFVREEIIFKEGGAPTQEGRNMSGRKEVRSN